MKKIFVMTFRREISSTRWHYSRHRRRPISCRHTVRRINPCTTQRRPGPPRGRPGAVVRIPSRYTPLRVLLLLLLLLLLYSAVGVAFIRTMRESGNTPQGESREHTRVIHSKKIVPSVYMFPRAPSLSTVWIVRAVPHNRNYLNGVVVGVTYIPYVSATLRNKKKERKK